MQQSMSLKYEPDAGLVEAMQARATATARYFKPDQMGTFVQALAKMGIKPDAGLEDAKSGRGAIR